MPRRTVAPERPASALRDEQLEERPVARAVQLADVDPEQLRRRDVLHAPILPIARPRNAPRSPQKTEPPT